MTMPLPYSIMEWDDTVDIQNLPDITDEHGFFLEVDLSIPDSLADYFSDFPPAPEPMVIDSTFRSEFANTLRPSASKQKKLVCNLVAKKNYIIHSHLLKCFIEIGVSVDKVHKALRFRQETFLKEFIEFNTKLRSAATDEFQKTLFKLLNNAVYGKTLENVHDYREVKLVVSKEQLLTFARRPQFHRYVPFTKDCGAVEMKKTSITLNKPMYLGAAILDLSKEVMYAMWYKTIKPAFGDRASLVYMDTDSFVLELRTMDKIEDLKSIASSLDTSNYPHDHPLHSTTNEKVLGKFKDELSSKKMLEIVALKSKCYAIKYMDDGEVKDMARSKGVNRSGI